MNEKEVFIIFGLKISQLRKKQGLSLQDLAKITKISASYLNEIEKGKKYPKTNKIIELSKALKVDYEELISLKVDKNLTPLIDILHSKLLDDFPLSLFGIDGHQLIHMISQSPNKVKAFIQVIIELSKTHNVTKTEFYFAMLRSFQELNDNYFIEIEKEAIKFISQFKDINIYSSEDLKILLENNYNIKVEYKNFNKWNVFLKDIRSLYNENEKVLYINDDLDDNQLLFILIREIAFQYLGLKVRINSFPYLKANNFEEVLNNFYVSYFSGAVLIPEKEITYDLKEMFILKKWDKKVLINSIKKYHASSETYFHRLTNILPEKFNIKDLFFIRLSKIENDRFIMDKELHINHSHSPHSIDKNEKYCRRWISITIFKNLIDDCKLTLESQISNYPLYDENKYWVISSLNGNKSISIGIDIKKHYKQIHFITDESIPQRDVGITCQSCGILSCNTRAAEPSRFIIEQKNNELDEFLKYFQTN